MGCKQSVESEKSQDPTVVVEDKPDESLMVRPFLMAGLCGNPALEPILDTWGPDELDKLIDTTNPIELQKSSLLIRKGDSCPGLYLLYSGELSIVDGEGGKVLSRLQLGDFVGEKSLLVNYTQQETVVASEPSVVYHLSRRDFKALRKEVSSRQMIDKAMKKFPDRTSHVDKKVNDRGTDSTEMMVSDHENMIIEPGVRAISKRQSLVSTNPQCAAMGCNENMNDINNFAVGGIGCMHMGGKVRRSVSEDRDDVGRLCFNFNDPRPADDNPAEIIPPSAVVKLNNPLPIDFVRMRAHDKRRIMWSRISERPYPPNRLPNEFTAPSYANMLYPYYVAKLFVNETDELSEGRKRLFNIYGVLASVSFKVTKFLNPYTGIFKTGAPGIIRLALYQSVASNEDPFKPEIALKLLIDNQPSINIFAGGSPDGQWVPDTADKRKSNRNFFANELSTARLQQWPDNFEAFNCKPLASVTGNGNEVEKAKIVSPAHIVFTPSVEVEEMGNPHDTKDFRLSLLSIPIGTALYDVFVAGTDGGILTPIGEIVLDTKFTASKYGDEHLSFKDPFR